MAGSIRATDQSIIEIVLQYRCDTLQAHAEYELVDRGARNNGLFMELDDSKLNWLYKINLQSYTGINLNWIPTDK